MATPDLNELRDWLQLELDGRLDPRQRRELAQELDRRPELAAERRRLAALDRLLEESQQPVRPDFRSQVMSALPAAGWEARHPRTWRWAIALLVLLGGSSAALLGVGSARQDPSIPFGGAVAAMADLFTRAALVGAGLLAASWKGVGLAVGEVLSGSVATAVALSILVVSLNLLFVALLRRSRRSIAVETRDAGGRPTGAS